MYQNYYQEFFYNFSNVNFCEFNITKIEIKKIIKISNPNEAHGHDMISIKMFKICGGSASRHIQLIFFIKNSIFYFEWKRTKVISVHKKDNKQPLINYEAISLLSISAKIFERLIYSEINQFFMKVIYCYQINQFKPRRLVY